MKRFLGLGDYYAANISKAHLGQVSNNFDISKFETAEENATMCILEHMLEKYNIVEALAVGENIFDYNELISYPAHIYFWKDDLIYKTLKPILGRKTETDTIYWEEFLDPTDIEIEESPQYSQLLDFFTGDVVLFGDSYYLCLEDNGINLNDIRIPGEVIIEDADPEEVLDGVNVKRDDPRNKNLKKHLMSLALFELFKSISPNNISLTIVKDYDISMQWVRDCNKLRINPMIDRKSSDSGDISTDWVMAHFSGPSVDNVWLT